MSDTMRLTEGGHTVDFSPRFDYVAPEDRKRSTFQASDGTLYRREWGNKYRFEVPVNNISSVDFGKIRTWWQNMTSVTLYPDLINQPSWFETVQIVNGPNPLHMMEPNWADKYEGVLILQEE